MNKIIMENNRERTVMRVTAAGAAANLALSAVKLAAGLLGKSAAMVADAVHSLSDLLSDLVVIVMVRIAGREKDDNHKYGHGKFETLGTVILSIILLVVGAKLMANAIRSIVFVAEGGVIEAPGHVALWAALISIAVKEILYQWTAAVGRKVNSQAMVANAWHHRSDALSSVGAAVGIGAAILFGGKWTVLDPIVGALISIVIIVVAVKMIIPAIGELTEASLPKETEKRIVDIIISVPEVLGVHELKTRRTGPDIVVDAHIVVDPELTVAKAHDIATAVEDGLRGEYGPRTQISIHVEPDDCAD